MPKRRKKNWSYNAGEHGRNWVRTYRQARDGKYYLEWREDGRRRAALLEGVTSARAARAKADELAERFSDAENGPTTPTTLHAVLIAYVKEVTPTKGCSKQDHDRRACRLWESFFTAQEQARQPRRRPETLDRVDWDRFISARRSGRIPGWPKQVRDRQVEYDLKFLISALNWAVGARLIRSNPWRTEVRRKQGWSMPKEVSPHRPSMPDDIREGLVAHAPGWQFGAMLLLERETRRRNSAIRRLLWSDIDFTQETIRWRAENDKAGLHNLTPATEKAVEVLRSLPSRAIGDLPVFPGRSGCTSRHTCQVWLRRAKANWLDSVPEEERGPLRARLRGIGFHSEKRAGVRDPAFRALPAAIQEELGGTKWSTLRDVYDEVSVEDMRDAMERTRKHG